MKIDSNFSVPVEWVWQPGHAPVHFEIWTIFTSIQQKKRMKIRQKFAKLMTKYGFSMLFLILNQCDSIREKKV